MSQENKTIFINSFGDAHRYNFKKEVFDNLKWRQIGKLIMPITCWLFETQQGLKYFTYRTKHFENELKMDVI